MKTQTITLLLNSEKKHSIRYDAGEDEKHPIITTLYVSKVAFSEGLWPRELSVAIGSAPSA